MNEKEIDMNELIESFGECSTDYTKTACTYYANYLENYQKEKIKLEHNWNELKSWLIEKSTFYKVNNQIYSYDLWKRILDKMQELERGEE